METNGFAFESTDTAGMDWALNRALSSWYNDRAEFRALQGRVMRMVSGVALMDSMLVGGEQRCRVSGCCRHHAKFRALRGASCAW